MVKSPFETAMSRPESILEEHKSAATEGLPVSPSAISRPTHVIEEHHSALEEEETERQMHTFPTLPTSLELPTAPATPSAKPNDHIQHELPSKATQSRSAREPELPMQKVRQYPGLLKPVLHPMRFQ